MSRTLRCPKCGTLLRYSTPAPPPRARCPKCGRAFQPASGREPERAVQGSKVGRAIRKALFTGVFTAVVLALVTVMVVVALLGMGIISRAEVREAAVAVTSIAPKGDSGKEVPSATVRKAPAAEGVTEAENVSEIVRDFHVNPQLALTKWRGKWLRTEMSPVRLEYHWGDSLPMYGEGMIWLCYFKLLGNDKSRIANASIGERDFIIQAQVAGYEEPPAAAVRIVLKKCRIAETEEEARERRSRREAERLHAERRERERQQKETAEREAQSLAERADRERQRRERQQAREEATRYYQVPGQPGTKVLYAGVVLRDARLRGAEGLAVGQSYCIRSKGLWDATKWCRRQKIHWRGYTYVLEALGTYPYHYRFYLDKVSYDRLVQEMAERGLTLGKQYTHKDVFILGAYRVAGEGYAGTNEVYFIDSRIVEVREDEK